MHKSVRVGVLAAGALALAACGSSSDKTGVLSLKITDSPVDDASEVVVVFTGVELKRAGDAPFSIDYCGAEDLLEDCQKHIDLLTLQDGVTDDLLANEEVPAGQYEWLRLKVLAERDLQGASYIAFEDGGTQYPLFVPSGAQTGLKLVRPFVVAQGGTTRLVVDFDIRKSVIAPPGLQPNYLLKPTLRLMDELLTGTIEGQVDLEALATEQAVEECVGGVYLFAEHGATPDDMDGGIDGIDPVVYRSLVPDENNGVVTSVASYVIPFVEAGEYTIAFTCNFDVDASPEESNYNPTAEEGDELYQTMAWTVHDVTVAPDETVIVDFPFPTTD
ncbi:MAG: DUF4382 domain-containing protein [Gammaproteobacteria bacterium]